MIFPGFAEGIKRIWEEDSKSQEIYLKELSESRGSCLDAVKRFNAFFVPNDGYIKYYFGLDSQDFQYELYRTDGTCYLSNNIVFPAYNLLYQIIGWVSYKPFVRLESMDKKERVGSYYDNPSSLVFSIGKYIFTLPSIFEKAMNDGYIVITDGVFDCISLNYSGINACSLLGSSFSMHLAFYFKFIDKIFVSIDNDDAGIKLYQKIRRYFPNVRMVRQAVGKDSDDILKSEYREEYLSALQDGIRRNVDVIFRHKFYS